MLQVQFPLSDIIINIAVHDHNINTGAPEAFVPPFWNNFFFGFLSGTIAEQNFRK